jgi:hypothetical protein
MEIPSQRCRAAVAYDRQKCFSEHAFNEVTPEYRKRRSTFDSVPLSGTLNIVASRGDSLF